jgi:hypothetical protein
MYLVPKNRCSVSKLSGLAADNVLRNPDYSRDTITYVAEMSNMTAMSILNCDLSQMLGVVTWSRDKENDTLLLLGLGPVLHRLMNLEEIRAFKEDISNTEQALAAATQGVTKP